MKLNKFLIISLSVLMLLMMCAAVVSAADSNEGSGSIDSDATSDDYTSDEDVDPEVTYESEGGSSNSVPLSNHATSNPLVLLFGALTLVGVCFSSSKK